MPHRVPQRQWGVVRGRRGGVVRVNSAVDVKVRLLERARTPDLVALAEDCRCRDDDGDLFQARSPKPAARDRR